MGDLLASVGSMPMLRALACAARTAGSPPAHAAHTRPAAQKWIMVWCGWDKKLWLSSSLDLEAWEAPRLLLVSK